MFRDGNWLETADITTALPPISLKNLDDNLDGYSRQHSVDMEVASLIKRSVVQPDWLPFAASVYNISAKVEDYVSVPVIILPTDLPNRNLTAFPFEELSNFNPMSGDLTYRGWKGKPVHIEHDNLIPDRAIGAIVDVSMRKLPVRGGADLYKVVAMLAVDTTKGAVPKDIVSGRRTDYSMGAWVKEYSCSVCGARGVVKPNMKSKWEAVSCGRKHTAPDRNGHPRFFDLPSGGQTLGFLNAHNIMPFEVSSVAVPAYASAATNHEDVRGLNL